MSTAPVSSADGMVTMGGGVVKDTTALQVISKTLAKVQTPSPQPAANPPGVGGNLDVRV